MLLRMTKNLKNPSLLGGCQAAEEQMGLLGAALQEDSDEDAEDAGTAAGAATGNAAAACHAGDADAAMEAASGV